MNHPQIAKAITMVLRSSQKRPQQHCMVRESDRMQVANLLKSKCYAFRKLAKARAMKLANSRKATAMFWLLPIAKSNRDELPAKAQAQERHREAPQRIATVIAMQLATLQESRRKTSCKLMRASLMKLVKASKTTRRFAKCDRKEACDLSRVIARQRHDLQMQS